MRYKRMPIEIESPEEKGYSTVKFNLAESSVKDQVFSAGNSVLDKLVLCYGDHRGKLELRECLVKGSSLKAENILLTAGAASALFIVNTSLLEKGDHIIVLHPNYSTNIETPRMVGCDVDFLELKFDDQFNLDLESLKKLIRPNTKLISITTPHNPTGIIIPKEQIIRIAELAAEVNARVLIDETYGDLIFEGTPVISATLHNRIISVASVSKAFGLPGIRIGWIICSDKELNELFLAAKEQIFICNSILDEEIAFIYLQKKQTLLEEIKFKNIYKLNLVKKWVEENSSIIEWVEPHGGVVCFPRLKNLNEDQLGQFYKILFEKFETMVGPGHWFEIDKKYFRIGFGWPDENELTGGLSNIVKAYHLAKQ